MQIYAYMYIKVRMCIYICMCIVYIYVRIYVYASKTLQASSLEPPPQNSMARAQGVVLRTRLERPGSMRS